ncbi:MAG: tetratricopeptide repeat protein, partial [Planctomycetota bacterium]
EKAMNGGDAKMAARTYRAIGDHKKVHPVLRQKALIRYARAAAAVGLSEGVGAYNYVLKAFPKCFYAKTALKELVRVYVAAGNDKAALETIDRMLKLPGVTASDKLEADVLRTSLRYGKAARAKDTSELRRILDEYKRIAGSTAGKPDLHDAHVEALLGQGNCLLHLKEIKQARSIFQPLTTDDGASDSVLAGAFNGLGECWFTQNNREGWLEARRCFLRTSIMYKDGTPSDELARALVFTGECFVKLQDTEDWNTRARNELNECRRRFPNSAWTKRAESVLRGMPKAQ